MKIIVAGPGCPRCITTESNVKKACEELGLEAEITHLYDVKEFPKLGIILTPAVVINEQVVVSGKVPTVEELKEILSKFAK
uniref:Thioredoxin family protein n=1 Tax=Thermodesulfobacterium geofontis TaxID=1295609 RepID=A0A7V4N479_9BACT